MSYLPDLQARLSDLLRSRERLIAAADLDDWARVQATPADAEIDRVRHLIDRISGDLDDLDPDDRRQIEDAVTTLRRSRATTVALGLPIYRQTLAQQRPERTA